MLKTFIFILCSFAYSVVGQDIHFSQLDINNTLSNPAATGLFSGFERVMVNHKNQWLNANTSFFTTSIGADLNLFKKQKGGYLGFGLQFFNDVAGDSKFGTKQGNITLSGILPLNRNNQFSVGFEFGFGQKSGQTADLLFSNQFDGTSLNPSINSGEQLIIQSNAYADFGVGLMYQYGQTKRTFASNNNMNLSIGVAMHHLNNPNLIYNQGIAEQIFQKLTFGTHFSKDFSNSSMGIESYINYYRQGPFAELYTAIYARYRLDNGSKFTTFYKRTTLIYGLGYRHKDAIIPTLKFQKGAWSFGLSYEGITEVAVLSFP